MPIDNSDMSTLGDPANPHGRGIFADIDPTQEDEVANQR